MQVWYIILGIVTLLFITTIINNIAEAVERRERERKIKILRYQRDINIITDYVQEFNEFTIPREVINLLENEILSRLKNIKTIDQFHEDIDQLITESIERINEGEVVEEIDTPQNQVDNIVTEDILIHHLNMIRTLISYLHEIELLSPTSTTLQLNFEDILITYKFEELNKFHSKKTQLLLIDHDYDLARTYMEKVSNGIIFSGVSNLRLSEIKEQAMMLLDEIEVQRNNYQNEQEEKKRLENEAIEKKLIEEKKQEKKKKQKKLRKK